MPLDIFFEDEEELFNVYADAYYEDVNYKAWLNGYYNFVAQITAISNAFGDGKTQVKYPDYSPVPSTQEEEEVTISEKDKEEIGRAILCSCY